MLNGFWLLFAWVWPLLLAGPALARRLWWLSPLGALPALLIAFALPVDTRVELPWLLLGTHLGLDTTGRIFLIFTAMLWLAAGIFAASQRWRALAADEDDRRAARFNAFFLLAMGGNFWLILGLDLASFYVGFAIMGLASYILVIHDGTRAALRAGKVYLIMALLGEVLLFAALAMIAAETGTTAPNPQQLAVLSDLAIALALLGLGVKAGIFPLHLWLPLAHPAAPIAASAVLSGTMIEVALLGWLRFLPVGELALPHWGTALILLGLFTLFFGLVLGLMQRDLKVILAYSSISKMGFLLVLLGLTLLQPALAPLGVTAIALYAAHHGLVKGGLFLGVGLRKHAEAMRQPLILGGLGFLALAMAGAPLTTGAVAKDATKPLLAGLPPTWLWLGLALTLSTIVTTALMARLLWLAKGTRAHPLAGEGAAEIAWALLLQTIIILPFALAEPKTLLANGLPVALGLGLVAAAVWLARRGQQPLAQLVGRVPPGDLLEWLVPIYRLMQLLGALLWFHWQALVSRIGAWASQAVSQRFTRPPGDPERELRAWPVAGALWLAVGAVLLFSLLGGPAEFGPVRQPMAASHPLAATKATESNPEPRPLAMRPIEEETTGVIPADPWKTQQPAPPAAPSPSANHSDGDSRAHKIAGADAANQPVASDSAVPAEASPLQCQDNALFIFTQADDPGTFIELTQCVADEAGGLRALAEPETSNRLVLVLQRNLQWLGYAPGSTDGMIGPATRDAIRAFEQANGLRSTGGISFRLLHAMNAEIARRQPISEP
ncbi:proton-conducting transporter transmembrane domain-containing protein [Thiorhodovibrio frisius]|uniref:Formate hydrogenlyase subunit 3/multisubunit Na+/H+ antiporter, MnhD subunit n=1 Tax=Thiorhodovibrio frisius TaxID=631362 RepID=H8Z244_9GAMM|nr:proton-conducting transporter membrane subunit [Thiorhodovibrio frisius]EIC21569.1 formate hydrogenlyase subunit 3/multisubunit Na+/H+ antiporter, MnhD subunit [Thiorhodovibrio frisius]WPL24153.1 Hydrogenase-4 component B [Thiorhodovibrio frisius]